MATRALASFFTATDQQFRSDHLKLCVLWYDEVLIETLGAFNQDRFVEGLVGAEADSRQTIKSLLDLVVPLSKRIDLDIIRAVEKSPHPGYPRWGDKHENYTYPNAETPDEFAHNALLARIAAERGVERFTDGYEIEHAEGRARVAVDAVRLWGAVNDQVPCMLQANEDEKLAMVSSQQFAAKGKQVDAPLNLFQMSIPSLAAVPWTRVVELRGDRSFTSLREKIAQATEAADSDPAAAKKALDQIERDAMNAIVDQARPRPWKVGIEAFVSNIPGLPVNPYSAYVGVRDTKAAVRKQKEHGWLYLLRDIRRAATHVEATESC